MLTPMVRNATQWLASVLPACTLTSCGAGGHEDRLPVERTDCSGATCRTRAGNFKELELSSAVLMSKPLSGDPRRFK